MSETVIPFPTPVDPVEAAMNDLCLNLGLLHEVVMDRPTGDSPRERELASLTDRLSKNFAALDARLKTRDREPLTMLDELPPRPAG
jgi:hypothetical protein